MKNKAIISAIISLSLIVAIISIMSSSQNESSITLIEKTREPSQPKIAANKHRLTASSESQENIDKTITEDYGVFEPISFKEHPTPQMASVIEAKRTGKYGYRLNLTATDVPIYSHQEFLKDPQKYIGEHVPGRIFQIHQPGPNIPKLTLISNYLHEVEQQDETILVVKAAAFAPVTFATDKGGYFLGSRLLSQTVQADADGMATVTYKAGPGVIGGTEIGVGCPMASRRLKFSFEIYKNKARKAIK